MQSLVKNQSLKSKKLTQISKTKPSLVWNNKYSSPLLKNLRSLHYNIPNQTKVRKSILLYNQRLSHTVFENQRHLPLLPSHLSHLFFDFSQCSSSLGTYRPSFSSSWWRKCPKTWNTVVPRSVWSSAIQWNKVVLWRICCSLLSLFRILHHCTCATDGFWLLPIIAISGDARIFLCFQRLVGHWIFRGKSVPSNKSEYLFTETSCTTNFFLCQLFSCLIKSSMYRVSGCLENLKKWGTLASSI